jgi:hypothetical protein
MKKLTAYDYRRQCWVEGEAARIELLRQHSETLDLLTSDNGREYLTFVGLYGMSLKAAVALTRRNIEALEQGQ